MPRGLFGQASKDEPTLTASPGSQTRSSDQDGYEFTIRRENENPNLGYGQANDKGLSDLHPYVQTLSLMNVDSCGALEMATFPEHERCSREKVYTELWIARTEQEIQWAK